LLDGAARIERDMEAYVAGGRGQVRILASVSAMTESLADDVAAFLRQPRHRAIKVDLEERVSPEIVRGVREGHASLGVCWDAAEVGRCSRGPIAPTRCAWPCRGASAGRARASCASPTRCAAST
jgi:DNA-binding transcriptional LysR family regulator